MSASSCPQQLPSAFISCCLGLPRIPEGQRKALLHWSQGLLSSTAQAIPGASVCHLFTPDQPLSLGNTTLATFTLSSGPDTSFRRPRDAVSLLPLLQSSSISMFFLHVAFCLHVIYYDSISDRHVIVLASWSQGIVRMEADLCLCLWDCIWGLANSRQVIFEQKSKCMLMVSLDYLYDWTGRHFRSRSQGL